MLVAAAPLEPAPSTTTIRARAWKVALTGGIVTAVGLGFFVSSHVLDGTNPTDATLVNTVGAFRVGGLMLMASGVLVALISLPMWLWAEDPVSPAIALTPLGVVGRW